MGPGVKQKILMCAKMSGTIGLTQAIVHEGK